MGVAEALGGQRRPDQDHCRGIRNHFHLSAPADYADDEKPDNEKRITIGEMWSSPMVFRRASVEHKLCDDAKEFNKEAKRRVAVAREKNCSGIGDGDRILILGEDEDGNPTFARSSIPIGIAVWKEIRKRYSAC